VTTGWMTDVRSPVGAEIFLVGVISTPPLGSTLPPTQWILQHLSSECTNPTT